MVKIYGAAVITLSELLLGIGMGLAAGAVLAGILMLAWVYFAPRRTKG